MKHQVDTKVSHLSRLILFNLFFLGLTFTTYAQTPQFSIGGGTTSNSWPFNSASHRIEHHWWANEFTGSYYGFITTIYFRPVATASGVFTNLKISMAQTTGTSGFTGVVYWSPVTTVFGPTTYTMNTTAGAWYAFTLTTPFMYDPAQSLIVQVCFDSKTGTGSSLYCLSVGSNPPSRRIYASGNVCASTSGSGPDVYRYDFGFDEAPAYALDAGVSSLAAPIAFCPGTYDVQVNLKNFGSTTLTSANINWTYYGIAQSSVPWTGSLATGAAAAVTLGSRSFVPGAIHTLLASSSSPNGGTDQNTANDGISVNLKPALSGTFTIGGATPDYNTFTAAVNDLLATGVCGPVTFNVQAGTYTEQVTIPPIPGASAVNTITFDGGTGNAPSRILQYSTPATNDYVIKLDGADYIRIKNLTINATGVSYGYCVYLTNQADYDQITNCVINAYSSASGSYQIGICAAGASYSTAANSANNLLIQNNTVTGGYYGILIRGLSTAVPCLNVQVLDNTVINFYYYGIYMYYHSATQILRNTVTQRTSGTYTTAGYGIMAYYQNDGPQIVQNKVIVQSYPMYVYYPNQANLIRGSVINNSLIALYNTTNYGMYVYYGYKLDIFYNSMSMNTTTGTGYGLYINYGSGLDVRNNSVAYYGTSGTGYLIYSPSSASYQTLNYNNYYTTTSVANQYYFNGTYYTSLGALQAAYPTFNANSVSGNPYYYNKLSDLHSNSHVGFQTGTPIAAVTNDFDNQARDPLTPCIGVDEFPQPPPEKDYSVTKAYIDYASGTWARIATKNHNIIATLLNSGLENNPTSIILTYKEGTPPANQFDGVSETFSPAWVGNQAVLTFTTPYVPATTGATTMYIGVFYPGDEVASNDISSSTEIVQNIKTFGYEDFTNVVPPGFSAGWNISNVNGGLTWGSTNGFGFGGTKAATYPNDLTTADDWLFTPGAVLLAQASYRVQFKYRARTGGTHTIKVYFGSAQTPGNMLADPLQNFFTVTFNNTAFKDALLPINIAPFFSTPNTAGVYYIAFREVSGSGAGAVDIDNVILDDNPVPPPKIGYGAPGTPQWQHIDYQNSVINIQATYKQSQTAPRQFEVVSTTYIYGSPGDFLWSGSSNQTWLKFTMDPADPTQYLSGNPYTPNWPRQGQKFTLVADPSNLPVGTHQAELTLVGKLYNDIFPNGIDATNQPFKILVNLVISASSGGKLSYAEQTHTNMVPSNPYLFMDQNGDVFASVVVRANVIPSMTIRVYPYQLPTGAARYRYVRRYWQIDATGRDWLADIDFYYTGSEANAGGVNTLQRLNSLRGIRQPIPGGAWEDPIFGTTSVSNPTNYYVHVTGIQSTPPNFGGNIALACNWFPKENQQSHQPNIFSLEQNYPNPFNPSTLIRFNLGENTHATLKVYDVFMRDVMTLVDEERGAGHHEVLFDASGLTSGIYYYRLQAGSFNQIRKMNLMK